MPKDTKTLCIKKGCASVLTQPHFFYLCRRRQNTPDMKRLFIFSTFLLCLLSTTFSQQSGNTIKPNLKYGKPSKEEFTMTSFAPDTTATAYADIQIPYYSNGRNPTLKENVSQLALFLDFRKQVAKQFNNKIIIKRI